MKAFDVVLTGFGNVGRAFVGLLSEKTRLLEDRYDLSPRLQAVFRSTGGFALDTPAAFDRLLNEGKRAPGGPIRWDPKARLSAFLGRGGRGVLVLCTASDSRAGEPGLGLVRLALARGWNVVTADKGPLVAGFKDLSETAARKALTLGCSAAAGAALPALDVGLGSLAGTEISAIEGILNGTTNFILTRLGQGARFKEALREAQAKGIAEPDPSRDISGADTAVKLLILANSSMGLRLRLDDIEVQPLTGVGPSVLRSAKKGGEELKYLGRILREAGKVKAEVRVRAIGPDHPLFGVNGAAKGVTFLTDTMGAVTVTGGKSDPRGAAAALLKDIINIYRR